MKNMIVGTAGHVDHGKTCLIKALTGMDTDRLKEEKKRGITIELGFANLPNDEGLHIGIIDVPGHEKFVKNMLAGIGGIDLVLLVIALDEGVMPQTAEHFEILKMLCIRKGIIVYTKSDLVDEDWAQMVEEDTSELVKGSFLEHAPRIRVSSYTGENIDTLKKMILDGIRDSGNRREEEELFRLPIDRVFTMEGFGTVITGTLLEGCCHVGQEVMVYPEKRMVKIRGIQSHGKKEEAAYAGQRTAINLVGVKKEELERGEILAVPDSMPQSAMTDARVRLFGTTGRRLRNGDRVHISYGSAQAVCKAVLLNQDEIEAGGEAFVQFRFDEPVSVKRGDRFIIRFYSPVETFGGGIFLEPEAVKHKRFQEELITSLQIKELGTDEEATENEVRELSHSFPDLHTLAVRLNLSSAVTEGILEKLKKQKKVLSVAGKSFIHRDYWQKITDDTGAIMERFHRENPIVQGMEKEEFKSRLGLLLRLNGRQQEELLGECIKRGILASSGSAVALAGFTVSYSDELSGMKQEIERIYREAGIEVPTMDEVTAGFKDKKQARQIIMDLLKSGELIKLNPAVCMAREHWERAVDVLKGFIGERGEITLGEYRDLLDTSRKYAVMLLESFDQQKLTKKRGDARILAK